MKTADKKPNNSQYFEFLLFVDVLKKCEIHIYNKRTIARTSTQFDCRLHVLLLLLLLRFVIWIFTFISILQMENRQLFSVIFSLTHTFCALHHSRDFAFLLVFASFFRQFFFLAVRNNFMPFNFNLSHGCCFAAFFISAGVFACEICNFSLTI